MPYASITLSSVGTSAAANLNWRGGKPTTVVVVSTSSGTAISYTVQYTLDDLQLTAATAVSWFGVSSNTYSIDVGPATVFTSSTTFPDGVYIPFPGPIGAVRMKISSNAGSQTLTMKVIQGEGW